MADLLKTLLPCFPWKATSASLIDEKTPLLNQPGVRNAEHQAHVDEATSRIIDIIINSTPQDASVQSKVKDVLNGSHSTGTRNTINILGWIEWKERVAEALLLVFIKIVDKGVIITDAMKKAYEFAKGNVEKFVEEHPLWTEVIITLIAMAMVEILLPWVLEALGFAVAGVRLGSWAARWQSIIGDVEKRSLFAFLQRLGMTFRGLR